MGLLILICVVLLGASIGLGALAMKSSGRVKQLETDFAGVVDIKDEERRIEASVRERTAELQSVSEQVQNARHRLNALEQEVRLLDEDANLLSFGFYETKYNFPDASHYARRLKEIRAQQKQMIKDGTAGVCHTDWTVSGDKRAGKRMMKNQTKLMLRAFNGECDAAISKVKYNNVQTMEQRINKSYEAINKIVSEGQYEITRSYLNLRLQELWLVHEHAEKKQEEKEEQKRIKEQMREEMRAEKELEKAQKAVQKEQDMYEKALAKAQAQFARAREDERSALQAQLDDLAAQLAEAKERGQRAISQAQLTRSGHVYIISNEGSFGHGVYKIGMTRRLEPMDRVKELGDASVPFSFDVHAMIYSEDAPALEKQLHHLFDAHRVNKINRRKEFFRIDLASIRDAVLERMPDVEFVEVAEAEEYRRTVEEERAVKPVRLSA